MNNHMAAQKNLQQIIRKDGSNCFVEVMSSAFEIEKVLFNFYTYDTSAQVGSRLQNGVNIYISFDEFYRLCNDIAVTQSLLRDILKMARDAKAAGNNFVPPKTIQQGGRSAASLAKSGQARPDNMSLARQLKIQSGTKYPVLLIAESGPGEQDQKGLIVPRYRQPECKVTIPFTYDGIKELFLVTKAHVDAYLAAKYTYRLFHPEEFKQENQKSYNSVSENAPQQHQQRQQAQSSQQYQPTQPSSQNYNGQSRSSYQQRNSGYQNQNQNRSKGYSQVPPPPPPMDPDYGSYIPEPDNFQSSYAQVPPPPPFPPEMINQQIQPQPSNSGGSPNHPPMPQMTDDEAAFWANYE